MPVNIFSIPEHITFGLDDKTIALVEKIMGLPQAQAQINSLADRLAVARGRLVGAAIANPDPNPTD